MSGLVFVYGTLRRGGNNHHRMEAAAFAGMATVRGWLYLVDWYPALVLDETAGEVQGEIYHIDDALMDRLDAYEGVEYERVRHSVSVAGGKETEAWLWKWNRPVDRLEQILSGDFLAAIVRASE